MARLDAAMVQQGLVPSRQRAKTLIQNGQISVNGKVCTKPAGTSITLTGLAIAAIMGVALNAILPEKKAEA